LQALNKEEMKIILGGAYSGTSSGGGGRSVSTRGNSYSSPTSNFGNTANDYSWDKAFSEGLDALVGAVALTVGLAVVGSASVLTVPAMGLAYGSAVLWDAYKQSNGY